MKKKTFDPRCSKVTNPFVQAYIEKQQEKAKPVGDRQYIVNILFGAMLMVNMGVLGLVAWSQRSTIVPELTGTAQTETVMGEAMAKIKQLEVNLQNMHTCVEFHKNAYYKLEREHETMKATIAQNVPASNMKEMTATYPAYSALVTGTAPDATAQAATQPPAPESAPGAATVRETTVAAQLAPTVNGQ